MYMLLGWLADGASEQELGCRAEIFSGGILAAGED